MDPLTHTMVGAALARTRIARGIPLAGAALIAGANLPDIDVLSHFLGDDRSLAFRRGWTHGPLALAVLPVLLTALLIWIDGHFRKSDPSRPPLAAAKLFGLAVLGTWTHPALDWLNTYGIRLLMPFDGRWFYGDAVFILDPWLWLVLGGGLFLGSVRRRAILGWALFGALATILIFTASPMLPRAVPWIWLAALAGLAFARFVPGIAGERSRIATAAVAVTALYIVAMLAGSRAAERHVRAELDREGIHDVRELMVGPTAANPLRWQVIVETEQHYRRGSLSFRPEPEFELDGATLERPRSSPLVDAVFAAEGIQGTMNWMRFPFLEVAETNEGYTVHLIDARYAGMGGRGFGTVRLDLDRQLRVLDSPLSSGE